MVLMLSGDGGWVDFEDKISLKFSGSGFNTVGFNSRDYFWESKTPAKTTEDLANLLKIYLKHYKEEKIILCGYSFGADVIPFIYNRLHLHLKSKIVALCMLSPFATSDFKVHTSDLLNISKDNKKYKVKQEVEKVSIPVYCFYGQDEDPRPLEGISKPNFHLKILSGNHSYDESVYHDIITTITKGNLP
jgi:type IV secretory pathway VirJ component